MTTTTTSKTATNKSAGKSSSKQQLDSAHNNNDKPLLVALLDPSITGIATNENESYVPLRTACPRTGVERDYLQVITCNDNSDPPYLVEVQQLLAPPSTSLLSHGDVSFASWMVGNHVIANNSLYVLTRVDPLFWMLPTLDDEKQQWQPLDQLLASKNQSIVPLVDPSQWPHLMKRMQLDEDEVFYQFDRTKAQQWLKTKQERVYDVLMRQCRRQLAEEQSRATKSSTSHGAFAAGFTLPSRACNNNNDSHECSMDVDRHNNNDSLEPTPEQLAQAKRESIQIVCNYLSEEWQTAFLNYLKLDRDEVLNEEKENDGPTQDEVKRRRLETTAVSLREHAKFVNHTAAFTAAVTPAPSDDKKEQPAKPKLSLRAKQLLNVNKKGMKSMASFFGVKKKASK